MGSIIRLIEGLIAGDPRALGILVFAVLGTAVIYVGVEFYRRSRRSPPME